MNIEEQLNLVISHLQRSLEILGTLVSGSGPVQGTLVPGAETLVPGAEELSKSEWHQLFLKKSEELVVRKGLQARLAGLMELKAMVDQAIQVVNQAIREDS